MMIIRMRIIISIVIADRVATVDQEVASKLRALGHKVVVVPEILNGS